MQPQMIECGGEVMKAGLHQLARLTTVSDGGLGWIDEATVSDGGLGWIDEATVSDGGRGWIDEAPATRQGWIVEEDEERSGRRGEDRRARPSSEHGAERSWGDSSPGRWPGPLREEASKLIQTGGLSSGITDKALLGVPRG